MHTLEFDDAINFSTLWEVSWHYQRQGPIAGSNIEQENIVNLVNGNQPKKKVIQLAKVGYTSWGKEATFSHWSWTISNIFDGMLRHLKSHANLNCSTNSMALWGNEVNQVLVSTNCILRRVRFLVLTPITHQLRFMEAFLNRPAGRSTPDCSQYSTLTTRWPSNRSARKCFNNYVWQNIYTIWSWQVRHQH